MKNNSQYLDFKPIDLPKFEIQNLVYKALKKLKYDTDIEKASVTIEHPQNEEFGDFSTNVAMLLAKKLKNNPNEIAEEISKEISIKVFVDKVSVVGGFINFTLKKSWLIERLQDLLTQKDDFGKSDAGKGKKYLIEHTSPNPNKAMHLGHLRNNVTGMAIGNIWEALGIEVVRDCIDNNRGIAIAKLMWGYLKFAKKDKSTEASIETWFDNQDKWNSPEDLGQRPDKFMDDLYVKGAEDFKTDEEVEKKVRQFVVDWESEDEHIWALWKKVLSHVYEGQNLTLERLGNKWDHVWHEHEHYKEGKDLVERGLKEGIFKKSEGAIVTDLEQYGISDTVVIKSDGTALYITQDLSLTRLKRDKFSPSKLFWVIGPEQSLALKQMFAVCEQLGIGKVENYQHIAYGYMSIKGEGKMSSRLGNVLYIDDLIDQVKSRVEEKIKDSNFSVEEKEEISEKVAMGAIKYSILKVGRMTGMAFDIEESVSFDGDSGPYLQYTYARARSILRKSKKYDMDSIGLLSNPSELAILRALYKFPETLVVAGETLAPNLLCMYLFNLAQKFNTFYRENRVRGEKTDIQNARLALTEGVSQILKNGLEILGIDVLEKM